MKLRRRAARQHLQDQSVLDHLTEGPARPEKRPGDPRRLFRFDTDHGRRLLSAIRKRWMGRQGLADF